jgi:hypothetical protein
MVRAGAEAIFELAEEDLLGVRRLEVLAIDDLDAPGSTTNAAISSGFVWSSGP